MTPEQIQQWAREAGIGIDREIQSQPLYVAAPDELQAFANIVRNATLEEAAQNVDEWGDSEVDPNLVSKEIRKMKT